MDFIDGTLLPPPLRRSMYSFLRICLLILMVLVAGSTAKSSVFSLFSLKSKSKFWSESVIRTAFDDLEGSVPSGHGKMEVVNYTKAEFKLGPEEMPRWFTKIDHIFEHTRIPPMGEVLTPFYKTIVEKSLRHHLPLVSHINYK
ncbi:hypothetical protein HPP92_015796 [Vanilla planifolia]|uniref:Uncharacterized protein n=1 Tax=Vanilla planifolia TaxID=51239 RepID=A0A835QQ53_VANPL|nr:hypothetical protein HPP92_015796 [Vanilla planifolia]